MTTQTRKAPVFIAIFTLDERDGWLSPPMAGFLISLTQQPGRDMTLQVRAGVKPIDYARNCVVRDFLASNYEWLLMIDNDMAPPPNLLQMLDRAADSMDILVPKFYGVTARDGQLAPPTGVGILLGWQTFAGGIGNQEWCELAWAGCGVMFVHRRVFERLGNAGWFRFVYDEDGMAVNSEDVSFCQKARKAGFSVWGNQRFEADHFKTVPLARLAQGLKVIFPNLPPGERGLELINPGAVAAKGAAR